MHTYARNMTRGDWFALALLIVLFPPLGLAALLRLATGKPL